MSKAKDLLVFIAVWIMFTVFVVVGLTMIVAAIIVDIKEVLSWFGV